MTLKINLFYSKKAELLFLFNAFLSIAIAFQSYHKRVIGFQFMIISLKDIKY